MKIDAPRSFQMSEKLQTQSVMQQNKEQAQKRAMKLIKDTHAMEQKLDADMDERRNRVVKLKEESREMSERIKEGEAQKQNLKEMCGVTDDSAEQEELELLEKRRALMHKGMGGALTPEERKRLSEIDARGMTQYQKSCLEINEQSDVDRDKIEQNRKEIIVENSIIRNTKIERLKTRPILEATKAAEKIMDEASREMLEALVEEGRVHQEEEAEKREEQAKERELKEREREERQKEAHEYKEELETMTEALTESEQMREQIQDEVKKMAEKLGLTSEELKGNSVDALL